MPMRSWPAWGGPLPFRGGGREGFYPCFQRHRADQSAYGERLGDSTEAASLARTLGQVWQRHPGQGLYAITADAEFEQHFGKKAARRRKIYNGMIPCQLYMYFEQPKR